MPGIDLSVIIVNYNVKDFLYQCLKSLEKASEVSGKYGYSTEIIVIDNNSTDNSINYLSPFFPSVKFIQLKENLGYGKANNIAFGNSHGKFILILNPDTVVEENNLMKMIQFMIAHPEVGAAGCKVLNADGSFQLSCRRGFPTPWASFTKLFGFQKIFPKSKVFAKYNQTYKSIDETYDIDAIGGAYMFIRKDVFEKIKGFDEDFFMYGEDIDLCYRISKLPSKVSYFHETSIIHYKGESTKRNTTLELKHFYQAMQIFAKKHYASSKFFLFFLYLGIAIRTVLAYFNRFRRQIAIILFDLAVINTSIIIGTYYKFGGLFNLPDYAYPIVFIVVSLILFSSMIAVGEYFEGNNTIRRAIFGLMFSFFILSSMTYYFNEYAFSRGILLFSIGTTSILTALFRFLISAYDRLSGKDSDRRIAILGVNQQSENIINQLKSGDARNVNLIGMITNQLSINNSQFTINDSKLTNNNSQFTNKCFGIPVIGNLNNLPKLIEQYALEEIIIADPNVNKTELLKLISSISDLNVKFHLVTEYEDLLASRIVNDVSKTESIFFKYNILKIRFRILKRIFDILTSFFLLTIGLPLLYLLSENKSKAIKGIWKVFKGDNSVVGLSDLGNAKPEIGKIGLTGLAQVSKTEGLNKKIIKDLNEYYLINYSFSLDVDILLKHFFRK
ncbi:MAG: glycosyltransferase [Bacteroidetes bacterium]|nr:glycosyltransferase [Bacteroidota bacterium]